MAPVDLACCGSRPASPRNQVRTYTMQISYIPSSAGRISRAVRFACGMAVGLAVLIAGPGGSGRAGGLALLAGARAAPAPPTLESLAAKAAGQKEELRRLDGELQVARKAHAQGEREAAQRAQEIEQLKSEPAGVGRDLRLQELLAQAQAQAQSLAQQAGELRAREAALRSGRERLVAICDQILAADGGKLPVAQRLEWLRLRTAQVEAMQGAVDQKSAGQAVRTVVQAGAALAPQAGADAAGDDDPRTLRERADLLRDSADKLRREVQRLKLRGEELSRRQRLRERAARVDEDLFAEQSTSRHTSTATASARDAAPTTLGSPAVPGPVPPGSPGATTVYDSGGGSAGGGRISVDPSTLDILQRAESLTDPVAKLQALQRAQAELGALTDQLLSRAARLERRAEELARKK